MEGNWSPEIGGIVGVYIAAVCLIYWAIRLIDEKTARRFGVAAVLFVVGSMLGNLAAGIPLTLLSELGYEPLGDRKWQFISVVGAGAGGWWARVGWLKDDFTTET